MSTKFAAIYDGDKENKPELELTPTRAKCAVGFSSYSASRQTRRAAKPLTEKQGLLAENGSRTKLQPSKLRDAQRQNLVMLKRLRLASQADEYLQFENASLLAILSEQITRCTQADRQNVPVLKISHTQTEPLENQAYADGAHECHHFIELSEQQVAKLEQTIQSLELSCREGEKSKLDVARLTEELRVRAANTLELEREVQKLKARLQQSAREIETCQANFELQSRHHEIVYEKAMENLTTSMAQLCDLNLERKEFEAQIAQLTEQNKSVAERHESALAQITSMEVTSRENERYVRNLEHAYKEKIAYERAAKEEFEKSFEELRSILDEAITALSRHDAVPSDVIPLLASALTPNSQDLGDGR